MGGWRAIRLVKDRPIGVVRTLGIWAGAIAIGLIGAGLQAKIGCHFLARAGSVMAAYGVLIGFLTTQRHAKHNATLDALQADQMRLAHMMHLRNNTTSPALHAEIDDLIEKKMAELD